MKITKILIAFFTICGLSLSTYGVELTDAQKANSMKLLQAYANDMEQMHQCARDHNIEKLENIREAFFSLFVNLEDTHLFDETLHQTISLNDYGMNLAMSQYDNITIDYQLDINNLHYVGLYMPNIEDDKNATYAAYSVPKIVYIGNKKIEHTELVIIDLDKKKILSVVTEQGTKPGDSFTMALIAYNEKRYEEALRLFEATIVKQCSRQMKGRCQYCAGIMYYKKQGCDSMKRADRDKKSYQLFLAAESNGIFQARLVLNRLGAY